MVFGTFAKNNNKMTKFNFLVLLICFLGVVCNQKIVSQTPLNNKGIWLLYNGDNKINSRIGIHSEVQMRNFFMKNTFEQNIIRVGLNFYVSPNVMLTAGYANVHTEPSKDIVANALNENRSWQQLILRFKTKTFFFEHRYRLEQRWTKNITQNTNSYDDRIRYRFQTLFPLYVLDPVLRHFFVLGSNEIFINHRRSFTAEFFDRNRVFFSLGYQVSPKLNFQIGYLNQAINSRAIPTAELNHNLQISIAYNMDDLMGTILGK